MGKLHKDWRTWWVKAEHNKTWMDFQYHLIEAQADLHELQQTYCKGGYTSGGVHNILGIQDTFANLEQEMVEYWSDITTLTTMNTTLTEQVVLYTNCLSTKEADNEELQMSVRNLQGKVKNIKA